MSTKLPELISREELAKRLGLSPRTLRNWAYRGKGPRSYRLEGGVAVYKADEVAAWLQQYGVAA